MFLSLSFSLPSPLSKKNKKCTCAPAGGVALCGGRGRGCGLWRCPPAGARPGARKGDERQAGQEVFQVEREGPRPASELPRLFILSVLKVPYSHLSLRAKQSPNPCIPEGRRREQGQTSETKATAVRSSLIRVPFRQGCLISSWQGPYQSILPIKKRGRENSVFIPGLPATSPHLASRF